ncbi:hypothetical protein GC174_15615 [bacterium]|nr:hypothetical protein [bacterium]
MTFTTKKPVRFIDDRKLAQSIRAIAEEGMEAFSGAKRFVEDAAVVAAELIRLAPAAQVVRGDRVDAQTEVEEWLFEADSLAFLKAHCRNRYWLWFLLSHLDTTQFPVTALALARAHARAKAAILDRRYGFNWVTPAELIYSLKGMPPGFVFELWETGRLLAHTDSVADGFGIIINPILLED